MTRCEEVLRARKDDTYERWGLRRDGEGRKGRARERGSRALKAGRGGRRVRAGHGNGHRSAHHGGHCKRIARRCGRSWGPRSEWFRLRGATRAASGAFAFPRRGSGAFAGREGRASGAGRASCFSYIGISPIKTE